MQEAREVHPGLPLEVEVLDSETEHRRHWLSTRSKRILLISPLALLLVLWLWLFAAEGAFTNGPNGKTFQADFAMFMGAAHVMQNGGNPYDRPLLYRTEVVMLHSEHIHSIASPVVVRVGNPSLFFWLLKPFAALPFKPAALLWMGLLYLLSAGGFVALLKHFGWRHWLVPLLLFLPMPQVAFGPYYGNSVSIVFAAFAFAIFFAARFPYLAGALLVAAWLKPPLALPLAMLILAFQVPERRKAFFGFLGATLAGAAATVALTGATDLVDWLHGLLGYTSYVRLASDIATLSGLYNVVSDQPIRFVFALLTISAALVFTTMVWHRRKRVHATPLLPAISFLAVAWLWVVWFISTPYAHFYDEILLVIPLIPLMGRDGSWIGRREATAALYAYFFSLLLVSATTFGLQFLWVPLVTVLLCLFVASRTPRYVLARVH